MDYGYLYLVGPAGGTIPKGDVGEFLIELPAEALQDAETAPGISWMCTLQENGAPVATPCPYQGGLDYQAGRRQVFLAAREEQIDALAANGTRRLQDGYVDVVVRAEVSAGSSQPPQPAQV